jgi:hypothetical protein
MAESLLPSTTTRAGTRVPAIRRLVRLSAFAAAAVCLALPAAVAARLPKPKNTTIVPGTAIAGVRLDMSQSQVFSKWGSTACSAGLCTWQGPGTPGQNERATVSFLNGKAIQVTINAALTGNNLKFKPGALSKWKTSKHISLGSSKSAVAHAYPHAKPNTSEGVQGFDLLEGQRPNLRYTRFGTSGIGASANRLRYIELAWDTCHYFKC